MASQPIIIVLVGPTGSGKSNFINKLMRKQEDMAASLLEPHTKEIEEYIVNHSDRRQYVFVDTPGLNSTYRPDQDTIRTTIEWLEKRYRGNKLTGIIYTHRITDNRGAESIHWKLAPFRRLLGEKAAERMRLVTTMWDEEDREQQDCELHLKRIFQEIGHERFGNTYESAWRIVGGLSGEGDTLLTQKEPVDMKGKWRETAASETPYMEFQQVLREQKKEIMQLREEVRAQKDLELVKQLKAGPVLYTRLQQLLDEQNKQIKQLQEDVGSRKDLEMVRQIQAEQRRFEAELQNTRVEMDKLKAPWLRMAPFFPKKPSGTRISQVGGNDYVIFVVGPPGAGKTWITRQLSQNNDMGGHSRSGNIEAWRYNLCNGSDIIVVDTPSFHSDDNNFEAKKRVADWLETNLTKKSRSGILFLHSLDSDPTGDDILMSWHLEKFAEAFPIELTVPSDVYVVPTSNPGSTLPSEMLSRRVSDPKIMKERLNGKGGWRVSMFPGVFKGQPETAWSAALLLLKDITEAQAEELAATTKPALQRIAPQLPSDRLALKNLAEHLFKEFRQKGGNRDLDSVITLGRTAVEFSLPEHRQHHPIAVDLADLLSERYSKEGRREDLDELITLKQAAMEYVSTDTPQIRIIRRELDDSLVERFKRDNSMVDLEEIISLRRVALKDTPLDRCGPLLGLANALYERFQKVGSPDNITEAVSLAQAAWVLCPPGHPDHALSRDHLASYLETKVGKGAAHTHEGGQGACLSSPSSSNIKQSIRKVVAATIEKIPLRLLHTPTGVLSERDTLVSHFEASPQYEKLLSSMSSLDCEQLEMEIEHVVEEYFKFVTLSHRWGSSEPLLRGIKGTSIYDSGGMDGKAKLQKFCILALRRGFQWAWSDTCCIDKENSTEVQRAIASMFSWYRRSSLTVVYLSDVSDTDSLASDVWFKRGWTLQELLASHTILFYTRDWLLYGNCDAANHKTDDDLLEKLHDATGIAREDLRNFDPGMAGARSRLYWASCRSTTEEEDIAYSLFGIFGVHLPVLYGESVEVALGRLLAQIISDSGDVSVLDWVGKASSFNSCFPANLVPYQTVTHIQQVDSGYSKGNSQDLDQARQLYNVLEALPRPRCVNKRLILPSITHPIMTIKPKEPSTSLSLFTYEIRASCLKPVDVTLSAPLDHGDGTYILARPWCLKTLEQRAGSDETAVCSFLKELEQPFNALLLRKFPHNEYKRIASNCIITTGVQCVVGISASEVRLLEIV